MRVELIALQVVRPVVRIHREENLVWIWRLAVIIFVPENDNGVVPFLPHRGIVNCIHERVQGEIPLVDERWIQPCQRAVVIRISVASERSIILSVLVVALIWHDEGIMRHMAGIEIVVCSRAA